MTALEVNGVRLSVDDAGDGPPLLLLHGFTGRGSAWIDHLPALRESHRAIAVDLLGHGASDAPDDPKRYVVERQAEDLGVLLDELGATPADILGYSMGARLALRLELDHPGVVRRLVLESPSPGIEDEDERFARRRADEELARLLEREGLAAFVDRWETQPVLAAQGSLPANVAGRLREQRLSNRAIGLAASLRGAGQGTAPPVGDLLGRIGAPTLVVCGALDSTGRARAEQVAAGIPGARLVVIPDAGHTPHLEQPQTFRTAVVEFLDEPIAASAHATEGAPTSKLATR